MDNEDNPDLTHWKTVMEFSVEQAALLVSGIDPLEYNLISTRNFKHPRWKKAHGVSLGLISAIRQGTLPTIVCYGETWDGNPMMIKHNDRDLEISMQHTLIARGSLINWIDSENVPVVGRKPPPETIEAEPVSGVEDDVPRLTFGGHESDGLRYVQEAIEQFWSTYDPDDPSTAPTKSEVVEYLQQQGATKNLASAADRVCRPSELQKAGLRQNRNTTRQVPK
jgi:hypothetical protein